MELFNEMTLIVCSYTLFLFTDYVNDAETRFKIGWAFIGIAVFNILVNWAALFYKLYMGVRNAIKGFIKQSRINQYIQRERLNQIKL